MNQHSQEAAPAIDEPLQESAPLAYAWAQQHCVPEIHGESACAWYHGSWQVLRLFDVFQSIRSDDDFFLPALKKELARGARRILISGAADYALLARVAAAAGPLAAEIHVTVMDRCATPLRLNAWYGERAGIEVNVIQGDILDLDTQGEFDLVCTHSFICFFDAEQRARLAAVWWNCLAPGGAVLTAQRARTEDREPVIRYSEVEVEALAERAYQLARQHGQVAGFDPDLVRSLASGYGRNHWTYLVRTPESIRSLLELEGFKLEIFSPPDSLQITADAPGTPNQSGSVRWRILARKEARPERKGE